MEWSGLCFQVNIPLWLGSPHTPWHHLIISLSMQIEKTQNFMKASILFFSPIFNGCVETNAVGLSNCGIL